MKSTAAWVTQPFVTKRGLYNNTFIAVRCRVCPWPHKSYSLPSDICGSSTFLYSVFRKKSFQYLKTFKPVYLTKVGWEEFNPSNIGKHPYTDICNNAISTVPWGEKQMSVQKIQMLERLFSTHWLKFTVLLKAQMPMTVTQGVLTLAPWVRQQQTG